jgi:hypothetical protein
MSSVDAVGLALSLMQMALSEYPPADVERYFYMEYKDSDLSFKIETTSSRAAYEIAQAIKQVLIIRVRHLCEMERRKRLRGG